MVFLQSVFLLILIFLFPIVASAQGCNLAGDANSDCTVDGIDYSIWLNNFNFNVTGVERGDFDGSGVVDGVDYVIWLNHYGTSGNVTSTPTVSISPSPQASPTFILLPTNTPIPTTGADPFIMAAGDIICNSLGNQSATSCRHMPVSQILVDQNPAMVLPLGDTCHMPTAACYNDFYHPSWGRVKSKSRPAAGNHEYGSNAAKTYFDYFNGTGVANGLAGERGKGYYSYDVGSWHLIALNTQCGEVGGCSAGSPQYLWLENDLKTHSNKCTLAYYHIPLFSTGTGNNNNSLAFWNLLYQHNADVVLNGHDHIYERFALQKPDGTPDPIRGIRQFTSGTGGSNHTGFTATEINSEVKNKDTFGILKLTLHTNSYDWNFVTDTGSGSFTDSGTAACH